MKTIVELYDDKDVNKTVSHLARVNYLDFDDLKQEIFCGILTEYSEDFDIDKYAKKIAMRMKRAEQRQHLNEMPFNENLDGADSTWKDWDYYFGDDDPADLGRKMRDSSYWRGCSKEMNQGVEHVSYSKEWYKRQREA